MSYIDVPDTKELIERILPGFIDVESLLYGASHSGHGVRFGDYSEDGENFIRVAAKPYWGRKAPDNAKRELKMTQEFTRKGFNTLRSIGVVALTENRDPLDYLAVYMTKYIGEEYQGGNLLSLEENTNTKKGKQIAEVVGKISCTLAQLHSLHLTHGDPQMKNFMVYKFGAEKKDPLVMDLEKANIHESKRNPGTIANEDHFKGAIKRDLMSLSYSLGSRQYGASEVHHFSDTVIEPYMDFLSPEIKSKYHFVNIMSLISDNFWLNKEIEKPKENY